MNHVFSTLIAPNGVKIKLLGEIHAKNPIQERQCNVHINDQKVTDILFESAKTSKFSNSICSMVRKLISFDETSSSIVYAKYFRNSRCKSLNKVTDEIKTQKIKYHDLEKNDTMHISDEMFALSIIPLIGLSPFTNRCPWIKRYVYVPILGYQFINLLFSVAIPRSKFSYPTKSKLSQLMVCDTILYRRDKIMAESIIEHAKNKIQKNDNLSLCIFGESHHEGICYYLQKNGFIFSEEPVRF